jgi:hypothetical protein
LALNAQPAERRLLLRTSSEAETAALLLTLHKTIGAATDDGTTVGGGGGAGLYPAGLPRKRHGDVFVSQIACTRGISTRRAARVRAQFSSVGDLLRALRDAPQPTRERLAVAIGSRKVADRLCDDLGASTV